MGSSASKNNSTNQPSSNDAHHIQLTEENFTPQGLYPSIAWDLKFLRRQIQTRKLAPFFKGIEIGESEVPNTSDDLEECPICFLSYPGGLNRSLCCKKGVCTECFLQVKKSPTTQASCPFCNKPSFTVIYTGPKSSEEKQKESEEQQKVIELKIKMRNEEIEQDRTRKKERESMTLTTTTTSSTNSTINTSNNSSNTQKDTTTTTTRITKVKSEEYEGYEDPMIQEAIRLSLLERGGENLNVRDSSSSSYSSSTSTSPNRRELTEEENQVEVHDLELDEDAELNLAIQLSLGLNVK